jgi:hypothetical protein
MSGGPQYALTRRELRANVIEWRAQTSREIARAIQHAAPGEDAEPEIIRPCVQNLVLGIVAVACYLLAIGVNRGWL